MLGVRIERALTGGCALLRCRHQSASTTSAKTAQRAQQEVADHEDDHAADSKAACDQRQQAPEPTAAESPASQAASAGDIFEIGALTLVAEPHGGLLSPPNARDAQRLQSSNPRA